MTAGQDGFRNARAKHSGGLSRPLHAAAFLTSRIDRSPSARFLARSHINAAGSLHLSIGIERGPFIGVQKGPLRWLGSALPVGPEP